ncbi:MAG: hypothetical protein IPG45_23790 [Deltaproteobacteria bacterium]|nr:hypothetical protein [Deltaproteobacteria bacterium]
MRLARWIGLAGLVACTSVDGVEALEVGPRPGPVAVDGAAEPEISWADASEIVADEAPSGVDAPAALEEAPPSQVPADDAEPSAEDAAVPVEPERVWGPAPVLVASAMQANLRSFSRRGVGLAQANLPGIARGLRHDRRNKDGYWILLEADPGVVLIKRDWSGQELRRHTPRRRELLEARRLLALDYVFGHQPSSDLLLLLYENVRGLPVVEGINVSTGETRFATRFSAGNFVGLRAETYRHGASQSLILLEWWVVRDGQSLELWRYDRGFLSLQDRRTLPVRVVGFDLPPWRELWGVAEAGMVRVQPDGAPGPVVPIPEGTPGAISIDE